MNASNHDLSEQQAVDCAAGPEGNAASAKPSPSPHSARLTVWQKFKLIFKVVEIRLRFIGILIVIGLFVGYWDTITNHWEKQTRSDGAVYNVVSRTLGPRAAGWLWPQPDASPAHSNTEFFCPMHPNVVRDALDPDGSIPKCPICGMPLSLRKKGAAPKLPKGVLSRKQYSPDQIQAAGIGTVVVAYQPLVKEITAVGYVTYDESKRSRIVVRVSGYLEKLYVDQPWITVKKGEPLAEIYSPELYSAARELQVARERGASNDLAKSAREKLRLLGIGDREIDEIANSQQANRRLVLRAPFSGHIIRKDVVEGAHVDAGQTLFEIADLSTVWIEAEVYEADIDFLHKGQSIEASVDAFPNRVFAAKVSLVHPHMDTTTRTNAVRFELENPNHNLRPGMFATVRIKTPLSQIEPFRTLVAQRPFSSPGVREVLAVPEPSVIDTGTRKIVYVEREPGLFDGVEVELGSLVGGFYPVVKGLQAGERVAARGAFLVDAETRLNPAAAAAYVGASGGPQSGAAGSPAPSEALPGSPSGSPGGSAGEKHSHPDEHGPLTESHGPSPVERQNIAKLTAGDREQALTQRFCPVSGEPLGSMGVPLKIALNGRTAFLCCPGCVGEAKKNPDKVLGKLAELASARHREAHGKQPSGERP